MESDIVINVAFFGYKNQLCLTVFVPRLTVGYIIRFALLFLLHSRKVMAQSGSSSNSLCARDSIATITPFTETSIGARSVGAPRVYVTIVPLSLTFVQINTIRSVAKETLFTLALIRTSGVHTAAVTFTLVNFVAALIIVNTGVVSSDVARPAQTLISSFSVPTHRVRTTNTGLLATLIDISTNYYAASLVTCRTLTVIRANGVDAACKCVTNVLPGTTLIHINALLLYSIILLSTATITRERTKRVDTRHG